MITTIEPGTVHVRFTLTEDFPVEEYLLEGLIECAFPQDNGTFQVIFKDVDLTLIDSLGPDELSDFLGIETEFVIYQDLL